MKLQTYRGTYIDLSGLPEPLVGQERDRLKKRFTVIRMLYGRISFQVYGGGAG